MPRWAFYPLFTVSGFAGLIYESIWTHYLKLFLGHAAYAQSLVLMVFMGGMAAGAAWCARDAARMARYARELLDTTPELRTDAREYLVLAGLSGCIAGGDKPAALELWRVQKANLRAPAAPAFRLLLPRGSRELRGRIQPLRGALKRTAPSTDRTKLLRSSVVKWPWSRSCERPCIRLHAAAAACPAFSPRSTNACFSPS